MYESFRQKKIEQRKKTYRYLKQFDLLKIKKMIEITIILCINFQRNWSKEMNEKSSIAIWYQYLIRMSNIRLNDGKDKILRKLEMEKNV